RPRKRGALRIGDRDQRQLAELAVERGELGEVEAPVERGHARAAPAPREGEMRVVGVEVDDVERLDLTVNELELEHVRREGVNTTRVEPQRARARSDEPGARARVAARKQRDLVPLADELLREVGDDPLRPAVEA